MSIGSKALLVRIPTYHKIWVTYKQSGPNFGLCVEAGIHKILLDVSIVISIKPIPNTILILNLKFQYHSALEGNEHIYYLPFRKKALVMC